MHHRPAGPPLSVRATGAFTRWGLLLRALLRVRAGRLVLAGVVTTAVTALVLVLPVVSGLGSPTQPLALDSSSSTTTSPAEEEGSPVVMGVDGRPIASSSFAGTVPPPPSEATVEAAPGTTESPAVEPDAVEPPQTPVDGSSTPVGPPSVSSSGSPTAGRSSAVPSSAGPSSAGPSSAGPSSGSSVPVLPAPVPVESPASAPVEGPGDGADELLALVEGARVGCAPLTVDGSLADAARAHSAAMREAGALVPLDGGPAGSIAMGGTAADVLAGWLADPTGQATILDCGRGSVGLGLVEGAGGPFWTLLVA